MNKLFQFLFLFLVWLSSGIAVAQPVVWPTDFFTDEGEMVTSNIQRQPARIAKGTAGQVLAVGSNGYPAFSSTTTLSGITTTTSPFDFTIAGDPQRIIGLGASSDTALFVTFGDASVTADQTLFIGSRTSGVDNDARTSVCAGGTASSGTGACLITNGNERTGAGDIDVATGSTAGSDATIKLFGPDSAFIVRDAGSVQLFQMTQTGLSTFANQVTLPGLNVPAANFETVAGAGTTVTDAAALSATKHIHQLTGANGTVGWKFPSATAGQVEILLNTTAGVPKVYAVAGGTCNGGAVDAACTLVTGIVAHICYATASNAWVCS